MIKRALNFRKSTTMKDLLREKRKFQNQFRKGRVKRIMNYYFQKKNIFMKK